MYDGKTGFGDDIGLYANKTYAEEKYRMNPAASGKVDLFYTGDFYKGQYFTTEATDSSFSFKFYSNDEKANMLTSKYGVEIWTFNKETLTKAKYEIIKKFKDYLL